ncbi:hypothetical protein LJC43_05175 [Parabacteroides sp. OttesenSCG-928-G21]|nr:hypothetical protein [Parabacteroides sp. OttesenSCG-928-G21]
MKKSNTKISRQIFKNLFALLAGIIFLLASCQDRLDTPVPAPQPTGGEVTLHLALSTPIHVTPTTKAIDPEHQIGAIKMLVFLKETDSYQYQYMVDGQHLQTDDNNHTRFDVKLKVTPKDILFLIYANYGDAFETYEPEAGTSVANVKKAVIASYTSDIAGNLPMYAEIEHTGGLLVNAIELRTVLLRAVARVDVAKNLSADSSPFSLTDIYIYRTQSKIQLAPDTEHLVEGTLRVQAASVPEASQPDTDNPLIQSAADEGVEIIDKIYIPESEAVASTRPMDATCIVVGGYFDEDAEKSYYRIDFTTETGDTSIGQVLRNHKYRFNIKKVLIRGYETPDEAATNGTSHITVEMKSWEDFTTEMYFNGDSYLGISARSVTMRYYAGSERELFIQSSVPYTISWKDPATGEFTESPVTVSPSVDIAQLCERSFYDAAIVKDLNGQGDLIQVFFYPHGANHDATNRVDEFQIESGSWKFTVTVTQETFRKYAGRTIRVLSGSGIGGLGHLFATTTDALPLRNILDNTAYFSPSGTVPISGFSFTAVDNTNMRYTAGTASQQHFRNILYASDVLVLTYDNQLSADAARDIAAWISEGKNRVLIVNGDTHTSSAHLLRNNAGFLGLLMGQINWWYYTNVGGGSFNVDNIGGNYKIPQPTANTAEFFNGLFGKVTPGVEIARPDIYAGYAKSWGTTVYPLLVPSNNPAYLSLGVNKATGIIFSAEGQLYQSGRMSATAASSGVITSDFDRLIANLWVWIVERVVREE